MNNVNNQISYCFIANINIGYWLLKSNKLQHE